MANHGFRLFPLTCQQTAEMISRSLDERLSPSARVAVRVHLLYCRTCKAFRRQQLKIRRALATVLEAPPPGTVAPNLSRTAVERIKAAIRERSN